MTETENEQLEIEKVKASALKYKWERIAFALICISFFSSCAYVMTHSGDFKLVLR